VDWGCWGLLLLLALPAAAQAPEGKAGVGTGAHLWMKPILEHTPEWYSSDTAGIVASEGVAYATVSKLNLPQHHAPWGKVEARRVSDGGLAWKVFLDDLPFGSPVVLDGHLFQLVGRNNNPGTLSDERADGIVDLDAGTGQLVRRIDLPRGVGGLSGADGFLYAALGRPGTVGGVEVLKVAASTGREVWTSTIPGYAPFTPVPTAARILVNVAGKGTSALDTGTGRLLWSQAGLPVGAPVSDGAFVYVLHIGFPPANPFVQGLEPTTGLALWTTSLPWYEWAPCQMLLADGRLIAYGSDSDSAPGSVHVAALDVAGGQVAWHAQQPETEVGGCDMAASPTAIFLHADHKGGAGVEWALDPKDGTFRWRSDLAVATPVVVDGVLVGLGNVRTRYDLEAPMEWGWLAVDAGAGAPAPPQARFEGPEAIHMQDMVRLEDRSVPGGRPIVAWEWLLTDSQGEQVWLEKTQNFTFRQNYALEEVHVTLTVMDDQYHVDSTTKTYAVLPFVEGQRASSPGLASGLLALAGLAAWSRRKRL
jgi:outer membrane protein assembly factor BamB